MPNSIEVLLTNPLQKAHKSIDMSVSVFTKYEKFSLSIQLVD